MNMAGDILRVSKVLKWKRVRHCELCYRRRAEHGAPAAGGLGGRLRPPAGSRVQSLVGDQGAKPPEAAAFFIMQWQF